MALTRFSWWKAEDAEQECGIGRKDVFSLTAGPLAVEFDTGMILGMASDPSINSVLVWTEKDKEGRMLQEEPLESDDELHPISATSTEFADNFWRDVLGSTVVGVSILVRRPTSARLSQLPNEVGLCFSLNSGLKMLAVHGLHDDSDDFAVIPEERVLNSLRPELHELVL